VIERVLGRAPDWRAAYKAAAPRWGALWVANLVRQFTLVACALPAIVGLYGALFAGLTLAVADASVTDGTTFGGTAAMLGLMAACLPVGVLGLALAAWVGVSWSLSEPVVVGEGAGAFQSLSRSSALVTGMRWRMLGRLVIFWIMQFMVVTVPIFLLQTLLLGGALVATETGDVSATTLAGYVVASVFGVAAGVLLAPLNVIYVTMNYLDLRVRKEQLDLQLRAAELATTSTTTITSTSTSTSTSASSSASASASTVVEADTVLIPSQRISGLFEQIARQGESAELLNELALAHRQAGDLDGALDALSRARELAPNDAGVAYNLALVRRARREDAAARRALADYLNLEDDPQLRQQARDDPAWKDYL
jgi:hypothetical protein